MRRHSASGTGVTTALAPRPSAGRFRGKRTAGSAPARGTGGSVCGWASEAALLCVEAVLVGFGAAAVAVGFAGSAEVVGVAVRVVDDAVAVVVEADAEEDVVVCGRGEAPVASGVPPQEVSSTVTTDTEATTTGALLRRDVMGPHRAPDPR